MTKSSLKARLERLGPVRDAPRARSGSPGDFVLRPEQKRIETITATRVLAKGGLSLLRAKRAIEAMITQGEVWVRLPRVEFGLDVIKELKACGIKAVRLRHAQDVAQMLKEMRENLALTQEQFALQYGFELNTLQNWEQGRTAPPYAHAYLRAIRRDPKGTALAQEDAEG